MNRTATIANTTVTCHAPLLSRAWFSQSTATTTPHVHRLRISQQFIPTRREVPQDAILASHQLLIKGGFIRMSSGRGLYNILPLGVRVLKKIEAIIDEELHAIGCAKLEMPILLSAEEWMKTGRWESSGQELFRLQDRHGGAYCIAPTHEETITSLVSSEVNSFRQLPVKLYQVGRKYRDEIRPRFGLLRSREFIMKDLYTFDATQQAAFQTYDQVSDAYYRIFRRMHFDPVRVEADSGNIGGNRSHEFHILSHQGFDDIIRCTSCDYAANVEKAISNMNVSVKPVPHPHPHAHVLQSSFAPHHPGSHHHHPQADSENFAGHSINDSTVGSVVKRFWTKVSEEAQTAGIASSSVEPSAFLLLELNLKGQPCGGQTVVFVPQGRQPQPLFFKEKLGWADVKLASQEEQTAAFTQAQENASFSVFADRNLFQENAAASTPASIGHFGVAEAGDSCVKCGHALKTTKGVEVGHIFYLGQKYSKMLDAKFVNHEKETKTIEMGCFGIGVSRLLAAAVEVSHDKDGMVWPDPIAPFRAIIVSTGTAAMDEKSYQLYDQLNRIPSLRNEVVIDDRDFSEYRFGAKMKDATLLGFPWIIIAGKSLDTQGKFEVQRRKTGEKTFMTADEIASLLSKPLTL